MKKRNLFAFVLLGCFTLQSAVLADSNYNYTTIPATPAQTQAQNPLQGSIIYAPLGITTTVVTTSPINSETLYNGYIINTVLPGDFAYNGKTIAPAGSTVTGSVVMVKKAGRAGINGQVYVRFNQITTPQGFRIPISAVVKTDDNTGMLKGGTKLSSSTDYAKNAGIGAAGGAVLGTALGAMAGGSVGKGAIYGTALGGGLGLVKSIGSRGDSVDIPSNAAIELYFDQPVTIGAPSGYDY